jgi:hypothetical protein
MRDEAGAGGLVLVLGNQKVDGFCRYGMARVE